MTDEKPLDDKPLDEKLDEKLGDIKSFEELRGFDDRMPKDAPNSPLFLIREKELEISGRVLSSKKKAEQIVADARKKATETLNSAEAEGEAAAREVEKSMIADAEAEAAKILAGVDAEVAEVRSQAEARRAKGVDIVVDAVKNV